MEILKGGIGVWLKRAKWAVALGLAADVAIIGGGCYGMYKFPQARLLVGEVFPPLQDAYYIYANKFAGKEKVLEDREADVKAAAEMFLQARHAQDFTRAEWYGMQPVQEGGAPRAQGKSAMQALADKFRGSAP
mmetsp:Transcript_100/g.196  ORF Transcript_100/g.196 Transcript_100/m.196 type:complete len:133 (+) Transcript_100:159-557(+)|eukprot:CAMPEP_0177716134 /NCGR_PEP_ID=MMETSP0484_2-20121128/14358_1 /TAXON_ID=354590 /ORGANISM="Rhodomonas lens, Strain RHODO" /LENGTH=132 /DNA_ID=CAMNT_0019228165 /DNA_START=239 /DNA_END=637 /DNA_ORIENTATION=+